MYRAPTYILSDIGTDSGAANMKKKAAIILLFVDLLMGLSLFFMWENKPDAAGSAAPAENTAAVAGAVGGREEISAAAGRAVLRDAESGREETVGEENVKKIALTFDDGPHPYYTEQLLDGLKERGVQATFFVTGEHARLHPDVIRRMQEDA